MTFTFWDGITVGIIVGIFMGILTKEIAIKLRDLMLKAYERKTRKE